MELTLAADCSLALHVPELSEYQRARVLAGARVELERVFAAAGLDARVEVRFARPPDETLGPYGRSLSPVTTPAAPAGASTQGARGPAGEQSE